MPAKRHPNLPAISLDPVVNAIKHCQAASPCLSEWVDYWQGKVSLAPRQKLSYHLNPDDSRLFGTLKRLRRDIVKQGALNFDGVLIQLLKEELFGIIGRLRLVFCKKSISKHAEDDLIVLSAVENRLATLFSTLDIAKSAPQSAAEICKALTDCIDVADSLNVVIVRREAVVDGKEPDESFPRVELGKYAKAFIQFADQNVGLVVYKDQKIGAFYVNRAAKAAWEYLRLLLAATSKDGWVVIEGNVRQGFVRTTAENDSARKSDVVRIGRLIHARQRGHTSKHEWKISTGTYEPTEHVE